MSNWVNRFDKEFVCNCGQPGGKHYLFSADGKSVKRFIAKEKEKTATKLRIIRANVPYCDTVGKPVRKQLKELIKELEVKGSQSRSFTT